MIKRILVAVDRSASSSAVFESAVSLAKTTDASLMLLQVLSGSQPDYPIMSTYAYYPIWEERDRQLYQEELERYKTASINFLQSLTDRATAAGVATEYSQLIGNPGRTICELAASWEADLILVGSRGLRGFKEMFLGSVSNYVTHHAPCSVLIVRHPLEEEVKPSPSAVLNSRSQ